MNHSSTPPDEPKILTLNLDGKKGVNILQRRYDLVKDAILATMAKTNPITLAQLGDTMEVELKDTLDGKIGWYFMAVKLDLEARGVIEKIPGKVPQTLRLKQS